MSGLMNNKGFRMSRRSIENIDENSTIKQTNPKESLVQTLKKLINDSKTKECWEVIKKASQGNPFHLAKKMIMDGNEEISKLMRTIVLNNSTIQSEYVINILVCGFISIETEETWREQIAALTAYSPANLEKVTKFIIDNISFWMDISDPQFWPALFELLPENQVQKILQEIVSYISQKKIYENYWYLILNEMVLENKYNIPDKYKYFLINQLQKKAWANSSYFVTGSEALDDFLFEKRNEFQLQPEIIRRLILSSAENSTYYSILEHAVYDLLSFLNNPTLNGSDLLPFSNLIMKYSSTRAQYEFLAKSNMDSLKRIESLCNLYTETMKELNSTMLTFFYEGLRTALKQGNFLLQNPKEENYLSPNTANNKEETFNHLSQIFLFIHSNSESALKFLIFFEPIPLSEVPLLWLECQLYDKSNSTPTWLVASAKKGQAKPVHSILQFPFEWECNDIFAVKIPSTALTELSQLM